MTPAIISKWIDQTRGMLDDDLVTCAQAARDVVNCQLDRLEAALLREAVAPRRSITVNASGPVDARESPARSRRPESALAAQHVHQFLDSLWLGRP
jgi:hypothetical protein